MAYRTDWKLSAKYICGETKELTKLDKKEIEEYIFDNLDMRWVFSEGLDEWGDGDRSFNDSDENMYEISKSFPQVLFTLKYKMVDDTAEGMYTEYWVNGEVQREKLNYFTPKFDVNKLINRF